MKLTGSAILALVALAGLGFVWMRYGDKIKTALNPASDRNVVNLGASSLVIAATGGAAAGGEDSVGGVAARAREWLSGDDAKIRSMLAGPAVDRVKPTVAPAPNEDAYIGAGA